MRDNKPKIAISFAAIVFHKSRHYCTRGMLQEYYGQMKFLLQADYDEGQTIRTVVPCPSVLSIAISHP